MPTDENKAARGKRKDGPVPAVPPSAIRMAKFGGTIALIAAAAISAQTLVSLGHLLGLHDKIAWLLPVSLDVYAATSIWVGYRIPAVHPAAGIARRDARLALGLTVCCNALFHLLLLAGSQLPQWLTDTLLIIVGALPPLVVERIFHLQMAVRDGDGADSAAPTVQVPTATQAPTERRQVEAPTKVPTADRVPTMPTAPPTRVPIQAPITTAVGTRTADARADSAVVGTADNPADGTADVIDMSSAGAAVRRPLPEWVTLALPHYRHLAATFDPVTAPQLADRLAEAGHGTLKPSRARDVCAATKKLAAELGDKAEPEPDRELIGAAQ